MFCEYSSGSLSVSSPNREAVTEKEYSKIKKVILQIKALYVAINY